MTGLARLCALAEASEKPAAENEQRAEGEEAKVVGRLVPGTFADMVDTQDLVVDDAFDKVEKPPSDENPP